MTKVFLVNGRLVIPEIGIIQGGLEIDDGRIVRITDGVARERTARVIDAHGHYVLPGLIDPHVHTSFLPPLAARMRAESAFAASGGITTLVRYFRRTESYERTFRQHLTVAEKSHYQDFAAHLTLFTIEQIGEMETYVRDFGITSFKVYMNLRGAHGKGIYVDLISDDEGVPSLRDVDFNNGLLYEVFRTASSMAVPIRINVHAEDAEVVSTEMERTKALGLEGLAAWNAARPGSGEALAISYVAQLSRQFGVPIYFPHIGSRAAIDALAKALADGTRFGAETGPQYVALTTESACGVLAKVMPPVRTAGDVERVWSGIAQGVLTCLGSDHIGYTRSEKVGTSVWDTMPAFGGTGLMLPIFLSEGVNAGRMTIQRLAEMGSLATAKMFHLYPEKGTLMPGADADLVIVDLDRSREVRASKLLSFSDFSVYEGLRLTGDVVLTAVRGEVVYRDGQLVGEAGHGRYIRRYPRAKPDGQEGG